MTNTSFGSLLGAACSLALAASFIGTPAAAAAPFDGAWTVSIATRTGNCDSGSLPITVSDGRIQSSMATVSGQVASGGSIRVSVGDGMKKASGTGKLNATSGAGTWRGGLCSGTWVAQKN